VEKKFTSDEVPLAQLLDQAWAGTLQLPDFQRGWVWDDSHITSLLASISLSYPIGAVMTLQTGNPDVRFRPRVLEGVMLATPREPELLLLDGQQRITSLYLALKSADAVPTRDSRGKDLLRHYYANINACIDPLSDREEEGIRSIPGGRVVTADFGRLMELDLRSRDREIEAEMFPLEIVLEPSETMDWQMAYLQSGPGDAAERFEKWKLFAQQIITPFIQYQVPTIQLAKSTPKEAVCQVFEKVNTGGVSLTVFELLTATYAADDFNLRDDWDRRFMAFTKHAVLQRFEATDFLQVVTLLATYDRRVAHLQANPSDDKAPAVTCKRRDVLRLPLADYQKWASLAHKGLERAVPFLHAEHVFRDRDLPYATQLVPLGAIFALLGKKADSHPNRQRLRQWFWCGVFGEMYGGSSETRFANDVQDCVAWIDHNGLEPRTVTQAQFQADRLLTLRSRGSAAYKGLYALQMKRGGRDFRTGNTIDVHAYFDDNIDIHHVFPQKWCGDNKIDRGITDSVVNKTAIDAYTNRRIGGNAPSQYLRRLEINDGIPAADLDAIVRSHDIDPVSLRQDDFPTFFNQRFERLLLQIEEAMGKPVNRSADRAETPFVDPGRQKQVIEDGVRALLAQGESRVVEFKSTALKNTHTGDKDPAMAWAIIRSLAAFMNAHGGTLLVGAADDGSVVGIEQDFPYVKSQNRDGWELWLTTVVGNSLGKVATTEVEVNFVEIDGVTIARLDVGPAAKPVFAATLKGEKREVFFARVNNSTQELAGPALLEYQKKRWPS
jgi:hypothetical protein